MKIYTREQFLQLPKNTVYLKGETGYGLSPVIELKVSKPGDYENDWVTDDFFTFIEEPFGRPGYELKVGDIFRFREDQTTRDGLFDDNEVFFAVFDNEDINQVIDKLKKCLK